MFFRFCLEKDNLANTEYCPSKQRQKVSKLCTNKVLKTFLENTAVRYAINNAHCLPIHLYKYKFSYS